MSKAPSNPFSEYKCPGCGNSRNGYENHHCPPKTDRPPAQTQYRKDFTPLDKLTTAAYSMVFKTELRRHPDNHKLALYDKIVVPKREYQIIKNAIMGSPLGQTLRFSLKTEIKNQKRKRARKR